MNKTIITIKPEITELLSLAHDKSAQGKNRLFDEITGIFETNHENLSSDERLLMSEILESLLLNVETLIRQKLANRLATMKNVPVELIILLANDQIDVARPILDLSSLLENKDLVGIIRQKSLQHQLSIAGRKNIDSDVCRQLVSTGNDDVIVKMLSNRAARIGDKTLEKLVKQSKTKTIYQTPIINRPDLPSELASRMYEWVSDNLKESLIDIQNLDKTDLETSLQSAVTSLQEEDELQGESSSNEKNIIEKLHGTGKLLPSFLIKCLKQGQVTLFELAFSKMINISHDRLCNIIYERDESSLAVACCAAGLDRNTFLIIYKTTRIARHKKPALSKEQALPIFEIFKNLNARTAEIRIHKWLADDARVPIF